MSLNEWCSCDIPKPGTFTRIKSKFQKLFCGREDDEDAGIQKPLGMAISRTEVMVRMPDFHRCFMYDGLPTLSVFSCLIVDDEEVHSTSNDPSVPVRRSIRHEVVKTLLTERIINKGFSFNKFMPVYYQDLDEWASIGYNEYSRNIGPFFPCNSCCVTVNASSTSRTEKNTFNLDTLRGYGSDPKESIIGKGVSITNLGGDLYLKCRSHYPVKVKSMNMNHLMKRPLWAREKVNPGSTCKIFGVQDFAKMICHCAAATPDHLYRLEKHCFIRIYFDGGPEYCGNDRSHWFEIQLHSAQKFFLDVLKELGAPSYSMKKLMSPGFR